MKWIWTILIVATLAVAANAQVDSPIRKDDVLTLQQCVEMAVKLHPSVTASQGAVNVSQKRVSEAKSGYYPQINASGSYSRISPVAPSGTSTSTGAYDQYASSVTLNQMLFDFGKTGSGVDVQKNNLESSLSDMESVTEQVIFGVKQAYYGVLKAVRNRNVTSETVKQFQIHLEQAKGFFEVGTKPKFDVTKAEVDLSNARLNLITADNAMRLSYVTLNNAIGVPDAPQYTLQDILTFEKYDIKLSEALDQAYKQRPDLRSAAAKRKSAEDSMALARTGYYPVLSGNAAYNWAGEKFPLNNGWSAGLVVSVPIFSGFLTKSQVEEARANLSIATANEESLRQSILLDVQQSYLNLKEAEDRIATSELTVQQAQENFDIANGRYAAGVGNPIEVTDAEVTLASAKLALNQALYDHRLARASIEKAMGVR